MKSFQWARAGRLTMVCGALLTVGLVGCAGDDGELARNNVLLTELNGNGPLFADVFNNGADLTKTTDDYVATDAVTVKFVCYPADDALTLDPTHAFGNVTFDRYTVDFTDNDLDGLPGDEVHDIVNQPMNLVVPANGEAIGAVLVVPAGVKQLGFLASLRAGGEVFTSAKLTFYGTEETSHAKIEIKSALIVAFSNYADKKS